MFLVRACGNGSIPNKTQRSVRVFIRLIFQRELECCRERWWINTAL